jgi:hypothetical protein
MSRIQTAMGSLSVRSIAVGCALSIASLRTAGCVVGNGEPGLDEVHLEPAELNDDGDGGQGDGARAVRENTTDAPAVSDAPAPSPNGAGSWFLNKGERLNRGQSIFRGTTVMSLAKLIMQSDGNLVLYSTFAGRTRVCWASGTNGRGGTFVEYQHDGNLVIYNASFRPVWASNTAGTGGTNTNINQWGQVWVGFTALTNFCQG